MILHPSACFTTFIWKLGDVWSRIDGNYDTNGALYATFPILPFDTIGNITKKYALYSVLFNDESGREQMLDAINIYIDSMSWEENYNDEVRNLDELMTSDTHECSEDAKVLYNLL